MLKTIVKIVFFTTTTTTTTKYRILGGFLLVNIAIFNIKSAFYKFWGSAPGGFFENPMIFASSGVQFWAFLRKSQDF